MFEDDILSIIIIKKDVERERERERERTGWLVELNKDMFPLFPGCPVVAGREAGGDKETPDAGWAS